MHDLCDALCFIQDILELFRRQRLLVASVHEGDGLEVHHLRKAFSPGKPYGEVDQQFVAVVLRVMCKPQFGKATSRIPPNSANRRRQAGLCSISLRSP